MPALRLPHLLRADVVLLRADSRPRRVCLSGVLMCAPKSMPTSTTLTSRCSPCKKFESQNLPRHRQNRPQWNACAREEQRTDKRGWRTAVPPSSPGHGAARRATPRPGKHPHCVRPVTLEINAPHQRRSKKAHLDQCLGVLAMML